jgi:insulysin
MALDLNQSESDKRTYKYFELSNKLKVIAVCDPDATLSAATMTVGVGSLREPSDVGGLAHFLEHMLFMGTEKYPEENYFSRFLKENCGNSNAFTKLDDTTFFFEIEGDAFYQGLDAFAQFFIAPIFLQDAIERETEAVD